MNKQEFIKKIYSKNYVNKIINNVKLLGKSCNIDPYDLLMCRLIRSVLLFCVCIWDVPVRFPW